MELQFELGYNDLQYAYPGKINPGAIKLNTLILYNDYIL